MYGSESAGQRRSIGPAASAREPVRPYPLTLGDLSEFGSRMAAVEGRYIRGAFVEADPGPDVSPASNYGRWPSVGNSPHLSVPRVEPGGDADRRPGVFRTDRGTSHQARHPATRPVPSPLAGGTVNAPTSGSSASATSCPAPSRVRPVTHLGPMPIATSPGRLPATAPGSRRASSGGSHDLQPDVLLHLQVLPGSLLDEYSRRRDLRGALAGRWAGTSSKSCV